MTAGEAARELMLDVMGHSAAYAEEMESEVAAAMKRYANERLEIANQMICKLAGPEADIWTRNKLAEIGNKVCALKEPV